MRFLLDTVTFVRAVEAPERLSRQAHSLFADNELILELSTISLTEVAINHAIGKLDMPMADVRTAIRDLRLKVLPYTLEHTSFLFDLPLHHRDPFDRQIIAQALAENIPVVTPDSKFSHYKGLSVIW
jgi:PIN domain nuclease of toxin-antitoxin system